MTELTRDLKLSIQMEAVRQCLKTSSDLAKQMQAKSIPSAKCGAFIAQEMRKDFEIWEAAQLAAEKALADLAAVAEVIRAMVAPITAVDVIPPFICTTCLKPVPSTFNGICWDCDDAIQQARSIEPCDGICCAGTVVQMPRRGL